MISSAEMVMRAWERGQRAERYERPAVVLAALSDRPEREALALGVPQRDAALLTWRVALFGPRWVGFARCAACAAMFEYALPLDVAVMDAPDDELEVQAGSSTWRIRWPTSIDLRDAAACADRDTARRLLAARCLLADVPDTDLPQVLAAMAAAHRTCAAIHLACDACGQHWDEAFDAGEFVWREIRWTAKRLLGEVDAIARAYGWSERDILALSQARRRAYLELIQ